MAKKILSKKSAVTKKTVKAPAKSTTNTKKTVAKSTAKKATTKVDKTKKTTTKSKVVKTPVSKSKTTKKAITAKKVSKPTTKTKSSQKKINKPVVKKASTKVASKKPVTVSKNKINTKKAPLKKTVTKKTVEKKVVDKTKKIIPVTKPEEAVKKERKSTKSITPTIPIPKPSALNLPPDKKPRVKNILISQPFPENGKSPFIDIAQKWKLKVDFRTFTRVEGLSAKEFRRLRIYITDYSAIIFNSRNAIDYFFKLCEEMRVKLSQDMKYFCTSEAIALYLQKYIQYRKRKVFYDQPGRSLFDLINKFKDTEKFLYPCSKDRKDDIPNFLKEKKVHYAEAFIYQTIPSDLSDLRNIKYDMIVFFSPIGIKSLFHNYPDFIQDDRRIGGFGQVTWDSISEAGLRLDIIAPSPSAASMAQAIENYLKESNK